MTASVLSFTDGTTTVTVTSGDESLLTFEPLVSTNGENVTENARVDFKSGVIATDRTNIQTLNRLFEQARAYARTQTGSKVYVEFDPGTSGTAWRSQIFDGKIILNDQVLGPWQYDTRLQTTIEWTRQPFWEGALTAVPLTNDSASDDVAGITISNHADGGICQVETAVIVGPIDPAGAGDAEVITTAAGMTGSPITTAVAVANDDTATQVATKMAAELNLDGDITDMFHVASSGANLVLTRLVPAANDATMNIAYDNDTCSGLTPDATSNNTTAGSNTVQENWVKVKAADVIGDLPAPIKIEMENTLNGADNTDEIFIFHNINSDPDNLDHILEGEEATGGTVTDTPDDTCSGDFYGSLAWAAQTETLIATWALSTTELTYMAGGRFSVLARWQAAFPYTNVWLRLKLEGANGVLWTGNLSIIPNTRELHVLDTLRLPPYLMGQSALKGIDLTLYALRDQSGTHTLPLDFLQLSAISGMGGWKRFKSVDNGVAFQEYFTHDATEEINYRTDTSSKIIAEFTEYGGDILLEPNSDQKLYFLTCDYNGVAEIVQTWSVKAWYRPRRNHL